MGVGDRDYNTPSPSRSAPMRSRWSRILPLLLLAALTPSLAAHDLFLKLADFVVRPGTMVRITALNGTFTKSENSIARARVADLSLAGPGGRKQLDTTAVAGQGKERRVGKECRSRWSQY